MSEAQELLAAIRADCRRPWTLMEVCGGQTHALLRHGLNRLLPDRIRLIHGPGCPVCVTASERLDQAIALASQPDVILCSYGDMLRVPGSAGRNLLQVRARGGAVRVVYAPLDVLAIARDNPGRRVVFLAVGFETTAPATALLARRALAEGRTNLELLICHVRVPPVLDQLLGAGEQQVQAVLAAGHVCTVMGEAEYGPLVARHRRPIVITGFSTAELLRGIHACIQQLEAGEHRLENAYPGAARPAGNTSGQALLRQVFEIVDTPWRGLGVIRAGGFRLRPPFDRLATPAPGPPAPASHATPPCPAGLVLQGRLRPRQCPHFGRACTPDTPLGAPMVSSEGACAAYHRYGG
ncbi:MAG: hydrogenase formation protein HypD [Cyanobacteriota bacterium]|jgi:hydrogenase expression/formation protein HypD